MGFQFEPTASSNSLIEAIENEAKKRKEGKKRPFRDSWEKWLAKTFGFAINDSFDEILLANARQVFEEFQELTAARFGREKTRSLFFSLCENIPLTTRKKILSTVAPHQLALILSEFALDDFKKDFQAMASAYNGKSGDISVEARESCISLFPTTGAGPDAIRKNVVASLEEFAAGISSRVGKSNAAKLYMRLVQCIPKSERLKIFLIMTPQEFGEMLYHFLF